jgi:hypothetical protein
MDSPVATLFKSATKDLLYPSETDAPFEISESQAPVSPPTNTPVEKVSLADFFKDLEPDPGFQNLHTLLQEHLTDIQIYRTGQVQITITITGKTRSNTTLTVQTLSVETG